MDFLEAIALRHSVRQYEQRELDGETAGLLQEEIDECNAESGLHIQLVQKEPKAFRSFLAHYGKFEGVTNYLALVGKKGKGLDEACGYYGERIVLKAQTLGLNTCWTALTYKKVKSAFQVEKGEKLCIVIALGYGKTQGKPHKSKRVEEVATAAAPEWFIRGVEAALLAPTAVNQQKFFFTLQGEKVLAKAGGGICTKIDLGIVKYHFELGSGKDRSVWL